MIEQRHPGEGEGVKKRITYAEVIATAGSKLIGVHKGVLSPDIKLDESLLTPREKLKFRNLRFGGREGSHLLRSLQRPGVEKDFALAYMDNLPNDLFDEEEKDIKFHVNRVINGQACDTTMFWTSAPYLYKELCEQGIEPKEAMKLLLLWADKGVALREPDKDWGICNLPGLEFINEEPEGEGGYALNPDPNHITHKFTAQEAKRVVEEVFLKDRDKGGE